VTNNLDRAIQKRKLVTCAKAQQVAELAFVNSRRQVHTLLAR
jgi:hypothetical protein